MIWPKPGKPASSREVSNNVNPRDIDLPGRRLTVGWLRNQVSFREFGAWVNSMLRRQRQYPRMAKYLRRGNRAGPCRPMRHRSRPTMRIVQPEPQPWYCNTFKPAFQSVTYTSPSVVTRISAAFAASATFGRGSISFLGVGGTQ